MKTIKALIGGVALAASAASFATPVSLGGEPPDLQAVINKLYTDAGTNTALAPDVNANQAGENGQFQVEASGGSVSTMVIEVSAHSGINTFGIYDINDPSKMLQLFSAADSEGGQKFLSVTDAFLFSVVGGASEQFSSATFGYYLAGANGTIFYSQAHLNGGDDHMVAFQGDGDSIKLPGRPKGVWGDSSYIQAWEDLPFNGGSDKDYQDFVVYIESITPVPEPGTIALLGLAGLGMSLIRRRKSVKSEAA